MYGSFSFLYDVGAYAPNRKRAYKVKSDEKLFIYEVITLGWGYIERFVVYFNDEKIIDVGKTEKEWRRYPIKRVAGPGTEIYVEVWPTAGWTQIATITFTHWKGSPEEEVPPDRYPYPYYPSIDEVPQVPVAPVSDEDTPPGYQPSVYLYEWIEKGGITEKEEIPPEEVPEETKIPDTIEPFPPTDGEKEGEEDEIPRISRLVPDVMLPGQKGKKYIPPDYITQGFTFLLGRGLEQAHIVRATEQGAFCVSECSPRFWTTEVELTDETPQVIDIPFFSQMIEVICEAGPVYIKIKDMANYVKGNTFSDITAHKLSDGEIQIFKVEANSLQVYLQDTEVNPYGKLKIKVF